MKKKEEKVKVDYDSDGSTTVISDKLDKAPKEDFRSSVCLQLGGIFSLINRMCRFFLGLLYFYEFCKYCLIAIETILSEVDSSDDDEENFRKYVIYFIVHIPEKEANYTEMFLIFVHTSLFMLATIFCTDTMSRVITEMQKMCRLKDTADNLGNLWQTLLFFPIL